MTTYTLGSYDDIALLNETVPPADAAALGNCEFVLSNRVDFKGAAITTSDIVQCVEIPAGAFIKQVWVDVIEADTTATDVDFGTAVDPDAFLDGVSFATTGLRLVPTGAHSLYRNQGTGATGQTEYCASADTIDADPQTMTTTTATRGAIVDVYALIFKPRAVGNA